MNISIFPPEEIIEAAIELPLSKSMSNRALVMNALTPASKPLTEIADCDDTDAMALALAQAANASGQPLMVNVGPAGTAMRFLAAYFAATPGIEVELDGNERMRNRPIAPLVEALRNCGAEIEWLGKEGFPPLKIKGANLHGGELSLDAGISSQFISALLMVAPTFDSPLVLTLVGEIISLPYLDMTIEMMKKRGISVEREGNVVNVLPGHYLHISDAGIERDWSAASYWYEISAMSAGWITLDNMAQHSLQGDSRIASIFEKLGVITEFEDGNAVLNPSPEVFSRLDLDLSSNPDVAQTLAVACCWIGVPFHFTGLESLKVKETDRIAALRSELLKMSFVLDSEKEGELKWEGKRCPVMQWQPVETYGDHRMAMAIAPVSLFVPGLVIKDAEVVTKSYPGYWDDMRKAGFVIKEL